MDHNENLISNEWFLKKIVTLATTLGRKLVLSNKHYQIIICVQKRKKLCFVRGRVNINEPAQAVTSQAFISPTNDTTTAIEV